MFSSFLSRHSYRRLIHNFHHALNLSNWGYTIPCRKRAQLFLRLLLAFGKSAPQGKPDTLGKHPPPPPREIPTQAEQRKTDFNIHRIRATKLLVGKTKSRIQFLREELLTLARNRGKFAQVISSYCLDLASNRLGFEAKFGCIHATDADVPSIYGLWLS
jgi:hypothetical protein